MAHWHCRDSPRWPTLPGMRATISPGQYDQLRRLRRAMSSSAGRVTFVNVPMANFLMVDGHGDAASEEFRAAVRELGDISATLRLYRQQGDGDLYDPMPLELLWWKPGEEPWEEDVSASRSWTAMVAQPACIGPELLAAVVERRHAGPTPPTRGRVRLGSLREGLCAQAACPAHANGSDVLRQVVEHARSKGYEPGGPHHEIFLADLRHRSVAAVHTILRQPIHRVA